MSRFDPAIRRLLPILRRTAQKVGKLLPDAHVYAGIGAIAWGTSILPVSIGPGAGFIVLGLGLIWIVRFGAEPIARRR